MHYSHLTRDQRSQIFAYKSTGMSNRSIALRLNVASTTIDREIKRNGLNHRSFRSEQPHERAILRRKKARSIPIKLDSELVCAITERLKEFDSPEQISGRLKRLDKPRVSPETIYRFIARDRCNGGHLYEYLRRRGRKLRKNRCSAQYKGFIKDRIDISQRPLIVEEKSRIGDLEIDTVVGAAHSGFLVTAVDRASKMVFIAKTATKEAAVVARALVDRLNRAKTLFKPLTITSDNGSEFALHKKISSQLDAQFFFAAPYRSWHRGLNEHTNGLIRQFLPKKCSFADLTEDDIFKIEFNLNNRPRKALNFQTPLEMVLSSVTAALHG
jgi:IS30 family transposase